MSTQTFTLLVEGPDLQRPESVDALFAAGCDDALVGRSDGAQYLDFDRESDSFDRAVLSAVAQIEAAVPGARVLRVADGGLVSMADIAERTKRTREGVRLLIKGDRGPGGFPAPVTDPRARYRLWRWSEVQTWLEAAFGESPQGSDLAWSEALNATLELRRLGPTLPTETRRRLQELSGLDV